MEKMTKLKLSSTPKELGVLLIIAIFIICSLPIFFYLIDSDFSQLITNFVFELPLIFVIFLYVYKISYVYIEGDNFYIYNTFRKVIINKTLYKEVRTVIDGQVFFTIYFKNGRKFYFVNTEINPFKSFIDSQFSIKHIDDKIRNFIN
jgi:hypothetical protein